MFILEESQLIEDNIKDSSVLQLYKALRQHEHSNERRPLANILASDHCVSLARLLAEFSVHENGELSKAHLAKVLDGLNLNQSDLAALALVVAATSTQLFVSDNFLGPTLSEENSDLNNLPDDVYKKHQPSSLSIDGSEVYHRLHNPWLLITAKLHWHFLSTLFKRRLLELEFLVWKHRYLTVHHIILLEPCETLINELRKIQEFIFDHHVINEARENKTQLTRFNTVELCCELVQSALLRDNTTSCRKFLDYASEVSGLSVEHTGVLGKRTKFQQNNVPQLVIKVSQSNSNGATNGDDAVAEERVDLLKDIVLEDDTLLPDISFVDDKGVPVLTDNNLNVNAQLLLLNLLELSIRTEVMEESLKDEWISAYLRTITRSATVWTIQYKALIMRSIVEKKHMRKMDRSLLQMEELIKVGDYGDKGESSFKRMRLFYSVLPPAKWQVKRSLGDISYDLALFKNALDVYTSIEFWEGIIKCYNALGQTVKSEKIIRQELAKEETPYLYCLLGDATDNIEYYEKSWTLSKCRFARAKKSIGTYYYVRKKYDEAIENYELALSASPSNISILSLLGYSCLTIERYERAAECYRNITYHDDSNFLAWNNLSKAYIKLNQKERAWRTLREAIKCNYEEWKIWENFMIISIEIGAYDDVITAWHRLIDIKSAHKDDQVLSALTQALLKQPVTKVDADYMQLLNDALKLVARLNATSDCSSRLWICYFKLLIKEFQIVKLNATEEKPLTNLDIDARLSKITNALQRATPTVITADLEWSKVPEKIDNILESYDELADCYLCAIEVIGPRAELWRQFKYFKLSLGNVRKTLERVGYNFV